MGPQVSGPLQLSAFEICKVVSAPQFNIRNFTIIPSGTSRDALASLRYVDRYGGFLSGIRDSWIRAVTNFSGIRSSIVTGSATCKCCIVLGRRELLGRAISAMASDSRLSFSMKATSFHISTVLFPDRCTRLPAHPVAALRFLEIILQSARPLLQLFLPPFPGCLR